MSDFLLWAIVLTVIALGFLFIPWYFSKSRQQQDSLSNTQVIKQRLTELNRELTEGLLSVEDKNSAEQELKLALLDEQDSNETVKSNAWAPMLVGAVVTLILGGGIYQQANQVAELKRWDSSLERVGDLAQRIVIDADPSIEVKDLEDFALAIRTRLLEKPDDVTGWLLLGRLHTSLNRLESALQAYELGLEQDQNHTGVLSSYSQALLMTGQEQYLRQAKNLLMHLVSISPNDADALGMLAVTTTQLGDTELAVDSWQKLKALVPEADPMQAEIDNRIASLTGEIKPETSILVNVALSAELQDKLPQDGYLFVFAQDASGAVRMPAAVVKSKLEQLPIQVRLSDANAMMPTYKLSQLTETRLVARISLDENVAQAMGELQGEIVVTVEPGMSSEQNITIDKELM